MTTTRSNQEPVISIVAPLYNEEAGIQMLCERLASVMDAAPFPVEVVLVNDGSRDQTPLLMAAQSMKDGRFTSVFLSRNHGHQLAVSAGIAVARGSKAIMIIDGDLQDPPELMEEFFTHIESGTDVVYAIRKKRKESFIKRQLYWAYYRTLKRIANLEIPVDSGDFSMISRRVADVMKSMPESSRYLRGMRTWIGFKQIGVEYERAGRAAGETKYTFKKLFELAYNGIFNFSDFPVKIITRLGVYTILVSMLYMSYIFVKKFFFGGVPEGFTTLIFAVCLFSGVQMICLGFIGEYVLRIYNQVRERPLFIIDKIVRNGQEEKA